MLTSVCLQRAEPLKSPTSFCDLDDQNYRSGDFENQDCLRSEIMFGEVATLEEICIKNCLASPKRISRTPGK